MINTMRLKQLYTILLLCCVNICFAQNKLFDKYADMDDVTSVYISKKMFQPKASTPALIDEVNALPLLI